MSTVSKTKIFIGTSKPDAASDAYTEITGITDIGEFGDTAEAVKVLTIDAGRVRKLKGARDAGSFEITVERNMADAGQIAVRAAAATSYEFNIKIEGPDRPNDAAGSKPTMQFLRGLVSDKTKFGDANAILSQIFLFDLTAAPITIPAVAA